MLSQFKPSIEKRLQGLVAYFKWINPNALTLIGIIPQALFFYFMYNHQFVAAAIALVFSCIDMLDGLVARATNKVSAFGAFLDSTLDRISDFLVIAGFYYAGLINLELFLVLLGSTYLISYARARAELASNNTIRFDQGLIERPERIIFLLIVLVIEIVSPDNSWVRLLILILTTLSIVTFFQRVWAAYKKL